MKMKKLHALFLSVALMLSSFAATAYAEQKASAATVVVDGSQIQIKGEQPFVDKGTSFVPLKPLFNELHIALQWDNKTKTVTGVKDGFQISLKIGSTVASVNNAYVKLAAAPRIVRGTTFVPLRFVGEATGYEVAWTKSTNTITLTSKQPAAQAEASKGFMWKVQNNGNTVYLVGSVHVANEAMYPLRQAFEDAFKSADYLGVEVDLTKVDQATAQELVAKLGTYTDGTTLKDHVSADTYKKVTAILKARGLAENAFDSYKPWVVSQTIPTLQMIDADYQADLGIDQYFMQNAVKTNKPIVQLETMEQQLEMFAGFSDGLQESLLVESINAYNNPNGDPTAIDLIAKMWVQGDDKTLLELVKSTASNEEYYKALLADRNAAMTEKIEGYLNSADKKTYFIVVGALHYLGEDGIVTKLQADGFKVEKH